MMPKNLKIWFILAVPLVLAIVLTMPSAQAQEKSWSWVENERGESHLIYLRSDDNEIWRLESFGGPISYLDNDDWLPIDTRIVPSATRDFEMVKAPYHVYLLSDPSQPKPVEFVRVLAGVPYSISYKPISLGWIGLVASATPTQPSTGMSSEGEFSYSDIFGPGTDLSYELRNTLMKELLEIRELKELPIVPPGTTALELRFAFEFTEGLACVVDGAPWDRASRVETDNQVYFTFKGENVFWLGRPYAYDNARGRTSLTYVLEEVAKELHVSLLAPYPWLSDKGRAWPVTLDPTTFVSTASDGSIWAYSDVSYDEAWEAEEGTVRDAQATFYVGQEYYYEIEYFIDRGFLFFDTSSIGAEAEITSAVLSLYLETNSDEDFDIVVTQSVDPDDAPHDPLEPNDYSIEWEYFEDGGSIGTADISEGEYFDVALNALGLGWIDKAGTTKLVLRSSIDISGEEPDPESEELQAVSIYSFEEGDGYWPMLVVEWSTAVEAAPTSSITHRTSPYLAILITVFVILFIAFLVGSGAVRTRSWREEE